MFLIFLCRKADAAEIRGNDIRGRMGSVMSVDCTTDDLLKDKQKTSGQGEEWHRKLRRRNRKGASGDLESGYSSMLESGYSSNRDSASPIPTLISADHEDENEDERERVWLMCQGGILPARVIENQVN